MLRTSLLTTALVASLLAFAGAAMADDDDGPERRTWGPRPGGPPKPEEIFKRMDSDGDGKVTLDEFKKAHEKLREKMQELRQRGWPSRPSGPPRGPAAQGDKRRPGPPSGNHAHRGPDHRPHHGSHDRGHDRGPHHGHAHRGHGHHDRGHGDSHRHHHGKGRPGAHGPEGKYHGKDHGKDHRHHGGPHHGKGHHKKGEKKEDAKDGKKKETKKDESKVTQAEQAEIT